MLFQPGPGPGPGTVKSAGTGNLPGPGIYRDREFTGTGNKTGTGNITGTGNMTETLHIRLHFEYIISTQF